MAQLNKRIILNELHKVSLLAKLRSIKWFGIPEELKALMDNFKEIIAEEQGHGGFDTHVTILTMDDRKYHRLVQCHKSEIEFIPSFELFITDEGYCHLHAAFAFNGSRRPDVEDHIAKTIVNYVCPLFENPHEELSVVMSFLWLGDKEEPGASLHRLYWGNSLTGVTERLIYAQMCKAKKLNSRLGKIKSHKEQLDLLRQTKPNEKELGK